MKVKNSNPKSEQIKHKIKLCVESILYIILVMFVVFLNIYGDIYIRTIPLLFLLGIAGKIIYDRPVITTIFTTVTSWILLFIQGNYDSNRIFMFCIYITLLVVLGELTGSLVLKIYDGVKKIIKISFSRMLVIVICTILIIIFSILLHCYVCGNIFDYSSKKVKLKQYIDNKYGNELIDFKIDDSLSDYHFDTYIYYLTNKSGKKYEFLIDKQDNIKDGYKNSKIEENNNIINSKFIKFIDESKLSQEYNNCMFSIKYIDYDNVELNIQKTVVTDSTNISIITKEFSKEIKNVLIKAKNFEDYNKITCVKTTLNSKTKDNEDMLNTVSTVIYKSDFNESEDYIYSLLLKNI